jgi:hypothetical protein
MLSELFYLGMGKRVKNKQGEGSALVRSKYCARDLLGFARGRRFGPL